MPRGDKLTKKQEDFLRIYLKTKSPKEAYKQAFDVKSMSDQLCAVEGNKLLQHPKITLRLRQSHEKVIEKTGVTIESILAELEEARQMGKAKENSSAMTQATMGKAKVRGLIIDRAEIKSVDEFERMSDDELREFVSREADAVLNDADARTKH